MHHNSLENLRIKKYNQSQWQYEISKKGVQTIGFMVPIFRQKVVAASEEKSLCKKNLENPYEIIKACIKYDA